MVRQVYIDFLETFEGLNPYELDHLTRALHKKYKAGKKKKSLGKNELQEILIAAMQDLQVEFAERKLEDAQIHLALIKAKIYKRRQ